MTHTCVGNLTIVCSDNVRCQAIIWSNAVNIANSNLRNKLQWNLKRNSYISIEENAFENVVYEMAAILLQPNGASCIVLRFIWNPQGDHSISSPTVRTQECGQYGYTCRRGYKGTKRVLYHLVKSLQLVSRSSNSKRPISQCIRQISHNALFSKRNVHICAHFCYKMVHCEIRDCCIVGFVNTSWICGIGLVT